MEKHKEEMTLTYGQVRDQTLKLLNQYTVAGRPVEPSYNNQEDYIKRIPALVNDAMMEIATTARKIPAQLRLRDLGCTKMGGQVRYELPEDFYQFVSGSVVTTVEGAVLHTNRFARLGQRTFLVPDTENGDYTLTYYRYPRLLEEEPDEEEQLDNEPETHYAIPFYAAAFLADHDDSFLCALFMNKFEDKLAKMSQGVNARPETVSDVYRFFG